MNSKKCKQIRKAVNYNPNVDTVGVGDYDVKDTTKFIGMVEDGINPDGSIKYEPMYAQQCTATIKEFHKRKLYKIAKKTA